MPRAFAAAAEPARVPAGAVLGVGLDLEDVASLPALGDPFFTDHFTPAELEAARSTDDARRHLCGVWCAKEAARKAVPALLAVPFTRLEVTTDAAGRPTLGVAGSGGGPALPRLELSITHTPTAAVAVVIALA